MRPACALLLAVVASAASAGCVSDAPPHLAPSDQMDYLQGSAQRFDPYTDQEIGPPVAGGRPREFDKPIAEPSRARWNPFTWASRWHF
jgi:hypothetical protein